MTVPLPVDVGELGRPAPTDRGFVAVYHYGFGHSEARCSCGWAGQRRHLKAAAIQDAWEHCGHDKCTVSFPLVLSIVRIA